MRNTFTSLSLAALLAFPLCGNAQQLPNNGFEEAWVDCIPWTSINNTTKQGTQPTGWIVSNTIGYKSIFGQLGNVTVASKVSGYNSESAIKVENKTYAGQVIPGYFGLGTPWSTASSISAANKDGGEFDGIVFEYRPDAISFFYQSTGNKQPSVVVYTWKGTYTQASVPGNIVTSGSTTSVDMVNRDRNILGMETSQGGAVTKTDGAECIAKINTRLNAATSEWTYAEFPFEYSSEAAPEMINVIFSADDYFSSSPTKDNTLTVDDVKLIYYSRLKDLQVNGTTIDGFASDKYEYAVDAAMPEESAFSFATLGTSGAAKAAVALDAENAKATVTVNNNIGEDVDGQTSHVYTVQFKKESSETPEVPSDVYDGGLDIEMGGDQLTQEPIPAKVYVKYTGDNICTVSLPDFTLDGVNKEDIIVPNVTVSHEGDKVCFEGVATGLSLDLGLGEPIKASASLSPEDCYIDADGKAYLKIVVTWHSENGDMPIGVIFNGQGPKPSAIEGVDVDNSNAPVEFYNLQGIRVNSSDMAPGIYIRRQGTDVKKVLVK